MKMIDDTKSALRTFCGWLSEDIKSLCNLISMLFTGVMLLIFCIFGLVGLYGCVQ
jgi:hypothetical protein